MERLRYRGHFERYLTQSKFSVFGRSLKHLVNSLADLDCYGIAFVSLRDNLDLSTPSGRLMFQIIGQWQSSNALSFKSVFVLGCGMRSSGGRR